MKGVSLRENQSAFVTLTKNAVYHFMTSINDDFFRRFGEIAEETFFIFDISAGCLCYLGAGAIRWWTYDTASVMERPGQLLDAVHPDDRNYLKEQLHDFGDVLSVEFRTGDTQANRHFKIIAYRLSGSDGSSLAAGWLADITNAKNNLLYAERINARKNSMLEILSHDLKEPIAMINMMAGAMKNDPDVANNKVLQRYISLIQELCDRNISLIRGLIQQEFTEAPSVGIRKERADLVWAVGDILHQYQASADVVDKQFHFITSSPNAYLMMDTLKIIQAVNNLISNAIKFTEDNGEITVEIKSTDNSVLLSVSDNGIGIPEELQSYLFERHSRAQRPGVRGEKGSGMGLFIIKELVQDHGGRVWYERPFGGGSRFCISLPKIEN